MHVAYKYGMSPFLAIFALGDAWVYIHIMDHSNMASNAKAPVD